MIKFKLNKRKYKLLDSIAEVTMNQAIKIVNIKPQLTEEELNQLLFEEYEELSDNKRNYIISVLQILSSDLDYETISQTDDISIIVIWEKIKMIIAKIYFMNFDNYESIGLTYFKHKSKKYKISDTLEINNEIILGHKEPAKNIIEAGNLINLIQSDEIQNKGVELLPLITAIFFREDENEIYDEEKIAERAELFKDVSLIVGFEAFFLYYYFILSYINASKIYLSRQSQRVQLKNLHHIILGYLRLPVKALQGRLKKLKK